MALTRSSTERVDTPCTRRRALAVGGAGEAFHLQLHHAAGDEGNHLPEEIGVGALLNQLPSKFDSAFRGVFQCSGVWPLLRENAS
jgi:hypothetical protein